MRLTDAARHSFARHETFHPRYGWFRKAYAFAAADPDIFTRENAPVLIGVGKNMVRSIRFWGLAAKLITENPYSPNTRSPQIVPTCVGHALFSEEGWDPYMEDPGTLWLLHWLLLAPPSRLPIWWFAFNEFHAVEFTYETLESASANSLGAVADWKIPHPSSIRKDVNALLRTYAPRDFESHAHLDDILDCPLRELNLIHKSVATDAYRFTLGTKPNLPPAIVAYCCLDFVARCNSAGNSITLSRLVGESGAPGKAFKLNESELFTALEEATQDFGTISLISPTGSRQLSWADDPGVASAEILNHYYGSSVTGFIAGFKGDEPYDLELLEQYGSESLRRLDSAAAMEKT